MKSAKDIFYTEEEGALILDSRIIKKIFKVDLHQNVPIHFKPMVRKDPVIFSLDPVQEHTGSLSMPNST